MKKPFLVLSLLFLPSVGLAQNARDLLHDFRRAIGEPDSTTSGSVTDAIAFTWLNMGLREFSNYDVFKKETSYVTAAGRDSFQLPIDFLFPYVVTKTVAGRPHDFVLSSISPDSGNFYLLNVGQPFLFERTDTIKQSIARPDTTLLGDVYRVRSAYRKDLTTGAIKTVVQILPESTSRIATTASDYFFYEGQPYNKMTFGKKATFGDTVFAQVWAIVPRYYITDTAKIASRSINWLKICPPPIRADTLKVNYAAQLDSMSSATDSISGLPNLQLNIRNALIDYMAARYYFKKGMPEEYKVAEGRWLNTVSRYYIRRGAVNAVPAAGG